MAKDTNSTATSDAARSTQQVNSATGKKSREKRTFDHVMTDKDKFALQTVLKCKNALSATAIAIQEGKPVNAGVVQIALELQKIIAEMLFA